MSDHDDKISQFADVTGVDAERARFYLESSAWQLEVALASFYENDGDNNSDIEPENVVESSESLPVLDVITSKSKDVSKKPSSRFATIQSMNTANSSDEEEGQAFYAGGSEHSGQQVLGPGKKKDIVDEMFKSVQEHGADIVEPGQSEPSRLSAFTGTGYKLGQSANDTEVVAGSSKSQVAPTDVVLKLWREGFSLNDGVIRAYSDPDNKDFLESVRRGEIPQELVRQAKGGVVHLNMEDHRHEEYRSLTPRIRPFTGQGHTLGSPTPVIIGSSGQEADDKDKTANEAEAKAKVALDSSQPITSIQIRLSDGSRLLGQFNHGHTINDVRQYILTARPQYENRSFVLLTTFPSKELADGSQTVAEAGLLNAAIMQRLK